MRRTQDVRRCFTGSTGQLQSIFCTAEMILVDKGQPYDEIFQDSRSAWFIKTDKEECQSNEMSYPIWRTVSQANRLQRLSQTPAVFKSITRTTGWQCENLLLWGVGLHVVWWRDTTGVLPPAAARNHRCWEGRATLITTKQNKIDRLSRLTYAQGYYLVNF